MSDKVKEEMASLLDGRRMFEIEYPDGVVKQYFIGVPTSEDIRQADWEEAKVYNRALKDGVFTAGEMLEILQARNIVGPEYERLGVDIKAKLAEKLVEMERELDEEKRVVLAITVSSIRDELFKWNQRMTGPMSNTCERLASDSKTEYLTSCIIQDKDGKRIWSSIEDYRKEKDIALQTKARFMVMLWLEGVEPDFLDRVPENLVLSQAREKINNASEEENKESAKEKEGESKDVVEKPAKKPRKSKAPAEK
jgi:hypothetical protein